MNTKSIYVIIVTWNGMKWIKRCLDALRESTYSVRTVVIDNGSIDETVAFIRGNYPEVHLIESDKNLGFGQANNEGMRYALANGCDYVFLLNQDAYVYPDMFQLLIDEAEQPENQEQYAIYSPLHINSDVHKMDKQFKGYISDIATSIVEDVFLDKVKTIYPVKGVPAAGWLLPRSTLETIGGFDPIFFHYGEDDHYINRIFYHGRKTGVVLQAKMIHDRERFGNIDLAMKDRKFRELKALLYLDINKTPCDIFRSFLIIHLTMLLPSLKEALKGNFKLLRENMISFCRGLYNIKAFYKNRKQNKKLGPNWL